MEFNTTSLRDAVQNACPGEKILWVGRPSVGLRFTAIDFFMIPFSLLWGGAIFFYMPLNAVEPFPFMLFPLFFKGMAVYMIAGRFIVDMVRRARTVYGLTERTAVILTSLIGQSTCAVDVVSVSEIILQRRGSEGSVVFGIPSTPFDRNNRQFWGAAPPVPTFQYIANADQVYQTALDIRANSVLPRQVVR